MKTFLCCFFVGVGPILVYIAYKNFLVNKNGTRRSLENVPVLLKIVVLTILATGIHSIVTDRSWSTTLGLLPKTAFLGTCTALGIAFVGWWKRSCPRSYSLASQLRCRFPRLEVLEDRDPRLSELPISRRVKDVYWFQIFGDLSFDVLVREYTSYLTALGCLYSAGVSTEDGDLSLLRFNVASPEERGACYLTANVVLLHHKTGIAAFSRV
jgi:hypothetical protein